MECVRQDEGDGGRLWGAMRKQDHVVGGKWRYAPSSTPKVTASPPTSVNSPEAFRRTIHAAQSRECHHRRKHLDDRRDGAKKQKCAIISTLL